MANWGDGDGLALDISSHSAPTSEYVCRHWTLGEYAGQVLGPMRKTSPSGLWGPVFTAGHPECCAGQLPCRQRQRTPLSWFPFLAFEVLSSQAKGAPSLTTRRSELLPRPQSPHSVRHLSNVKRKAGICCFSSHFVQEKDPAFSSLAATE